MKTIKIEEKDWERLSKIKIDLRAESISDVINRILKIVSASELTKTKNE